LESELGLSLLFGGGCGVGNCDRGIAWESAAGVSRLLSFGTESRVDSDPSDSAPPSESVEVIA
jgi:hypothetical protein